MLALHLQGILLLFQRGDVMGDAEHPDQLSLTVVEGGLAGLHTLAVAIGKGQPFLVDLGATVLDRCQVVGATLLGVLAREQVEVAFTQHLTLVEAPQ